MRDDERERAFLEPIKRELSREVDNSDAALIRRGLNIRMKMGGPFDNRRTVVVTYDAGPWELGRISNAPLLKNECVTYQAIVETWQQDGRLHGRVISKPVGLERKPKDPQIAYLLSTGATP